MPSDGPTPAADDVSAAVGETVRDDAEGGEPEGNDTVRDDAGGGESEGDETVGDDAGGGEPEGDDSGGGEEEEASSHTLVQDLFNNPASWAVWPAIGILRWALRNTPGEPRRLIYRSLPSLAFKPNEIHSVVLKNDSIDVTLTAPGIASPGSPLPTSDIARIVADYHTPGQGALATWLDGPVDLLMQVLETAQTRSSAAFALATGGRVQSILRAASLVGHTAPLQALPGHRLTERPGAEPEGAAGLAALFVGNPSASGLATLVEAFTGLPARVEEFAGARVRTQRPAAIGGPLMRVLGRYSILPTAAIEVIIEGVGREGARRWALEPRRCASLRLLCERYVGSNGIAIRLFLELDAHNVEACPLENVTLGGMAILGQPAETPEPSDGPVLLPLRA